MTSAMCVAGDDVTGAQLLLDDDALCTHRGHAIHHRLRHPRPRRRRVHLCLCLCRRRQRPGHDQPALGQGLARHQHPARHLLLAPGVHSRACSLLLDDADPTTLCRQDNFDLLVIPGGAQGADTISKNSHVQHLVRAYLDHNKLVAMICAGALAALTSRLPSQPLTSHPSVKPVLDKDFDYSEEPVVVSGKLVTSRGPGQCRISLQDCPALTPQQAPPSPSPSPSSSCSAAPTSAQTSRAPWSSPRSESAARCK
ncbi:hypothetical protein AcV5_000239 [Taiwanofungus camphoratus]|nr:hypothetical protein AcV5_000239 [Antrodia cinnamomea]